MGAQGWEKGLNAHGISEACLFARARNCLELADPACKVAATANAAAEFSAGSLRIDDAAEPAPLMGTPGRPALPRLVAPRQLPQRGLGSPQGRAALVHAVAHIEFNAINLAWDAVYRFRGMPREYYA